MPRPDVGADLVSARHAGIGRAYGADTRSAPTTILRAIGLTLLALALASYAFAFGGSQTTWLGGALPWDTVPYLEADPQVLVETGTGAPAAGLGLDLGLTDWWMASGSWIKALDGGTSNARVLTRARLHPAPWAGLGAALYAGAELPEGAASVVLGGGIVALEFEGHSLSLNGEARSSGAASLWRAAYRTPYLYYGLRLALEAALDSQGSAWTLPALVYNLPGDLSLDAGVRFSADGSGSWRSLLRLSYELFPSP